MQNLQVILVVVIVVVILVVIMNGTCKFSCLSGSSGYKNLSSKSDLKGKIGQSGRWNPKYKDYSISKLIRGHPGCPKCMAGCVKAMDPSKGDDLKTLLHTCKNIVCRQKCSR